MPHYRRVRDAAIADVGRAITMALGGAIAFAPVEYVLTLWSYAGVGTWSSRIKLAALTATLSLVLALLLALGLAGLMVGVRLIRAQVDPIAARRSSWAVPTPLADGIRAGVPRVWGTVVAAIVCALSTQRVVVWAMKTYKEPELTALLIAGISLAVIAASLVAQRALTFVTTIAARALAPVFGSINPLGRWRAAGLALAGFAGAAVGVCWLALPQSRSVLPVRLIISALVVGLGMGVGALVHARTIERPLAQLWVRLGILGLAALVFQWFLIPMNVWWTPARIVTILAALVIAILLGSRIQLRRRERRNGLGFALASLLLSTLTFLWWGADLTAKYTAITASPALEKLIGYVRTANDLDRDGFGTVLGEADCAPFDKRINPGAIDAPDDGIDQNCDGRDFSMSSLVTPSGPTVEVPPQFKKPWNVLLLTIDTVRYDRTTFGGYAKSAKKRDTTPRLAELVKRSTSFTFANAPSAGTMASIPAIMTSKFFHSGIALGPGAPGIPPQILPENTLLSEIMKGAGYRTGVIGSHEWWNDWGLEQGVDDYDNSIGKTGDPYRVAADKVTDHALAWISRHQGQKWFMWAHYIDPHGRYVAHPNVVDYGSTEYDLYDAELKWTDQQVGRLLDELRRLPSNDNTIIIITSDHGDSMAEHGIPLGTHGTALYREMLHVPLIIYVPNNTARELGGAVTPLDIVPTIAELCQIDVKELSFEGRSLVPALFAGREDKERIVFAETNAPKRQRAAISESWKLIFYLHNNVHELFDLKADPWEKTNLAPANPPAFAVMKQALQLWMDRVLYSRDPVFNQAYRQTADLFSSDEPPVRTEKQTLANGAIEVLGIGPVAGQTYAPGARTEVHVYFASRQPTSTAYRFQLVAWPGSVTDPLPPTALRSGLRGTLDGGFMTDRWKPGDRIRERFPIALPADWTSPTMVVGLVAVEPQPGDRKVTATGLTPPNDPTVAILGVLPVQVPVQVPAPAPQAGSSTPPTP